MKAQIEMALMSPRMDNPWFMNDVRAEQPRGAPRPNGSVKSLQRTRWLNAGIAKGSIGSIQDRN
jgi:hypothetical protein